MEGVCTQDEDGGADGGFFRGHAGFERVSSTGDHGIEEGVFVETAAGMGIPFLNVCEEFESGFVISFTWRFGAGCFYGVAFC